MPSHSKIIILRLFYHGFHIMPAIYVLTQATYFIVATNKAQSLWKLEDENKVILYSNN